jgi:uncharacterized protein (DUF1800 family)
MKGKANKVTKARTVCVITLLILVSFSRAHTGTIPSELKSIHVLNRLAFGPRPGDVERVKSIGIEHYIKEQLSPEALALPSSLAKKLDDLSTLHQTPVQLFAEYGPSLGAKKEDPEAVKLAQQRARVILEQVSEARILRAVESPRQLHEVMVNFWFNHFNVFAGKGLDRLWVGTYEEQAIRPYALGRFRDLLTATAMHPAMLFYLDNWQNTAPDSRGVRGRFKGLNENYARELMELHTLGVDGGYTQQDVIALARILTGWGIRTQGGSFQLSSERQRRFGAFSQTASDGTGFFFDANRHDFSDKVFLGRTIRGSGIAEVEQALDILVRSPATARHIGFQLAQYFVADEPPKSLVDRLANRFLETDGNIRSVLDTLFHGPEFWDEKYYGKKFKTPYEYVISAVRAAGVEVRNVKPLLGMVRQLGMPLYGCQTPDGYKNTQEAWLNPNAMTQRINFVTALAGGHLRINQMPPNSMNETGSDASYPMVNQPARMEPLDPSELHRALGDRLSVKTSEALEATPARLRTAVILGSPDFMQR